MMKNILQNLFPGLLVFLVALPLCLGIALGSGAPAFSGLIAGIIGGIVVGAISGSHLSVSGPAAGLTVIVAAAIVQLQDYRLFLLAVVLAGAMQIGFGLLKAGRLGEYIPNNVIKGMMAAIGFILIMKQIPHLVGYDHDFEGDEDFAQLDGENTFSEIIIAFLKITPAAALVGICSLIILMLWEMKSLKKFSFFKWMPGSLVVVIAGLVYTQVTKEWENWRMATEHLVNVPVVASLQEWPQQLQFPDFAGLLQPKVWVVAITLAIVASLESLLGVEAVEKLDPLKRNTPSNLELIAQGCGNMASGIIGGIPVTSVVVRSTANISAGATHKMSTILHGIFLLISVVLFPHLLNAIPLASLAAVLIFVGYKLVKPRIFKDIWDQGKIQFLPFLVTFVAIIATDLLKGIGIGLLVGIYFVIRRNFKEGVQLYEHEGNFLLRFQQEVTFLNRPLLKEKIRKIPSGSSVLLDFSKTERLDQDIREIIDDFVIHAPHDQVKIEFKYNQRKSNFVKF
jgi:MFS superfamily sulfate permease-like transporter